jgi:molybdopterin-guanine dinucleotide biosynthesis protein MobB
MIPIVSIVGTSHSGKTTLLEKVVPELIARGYRVAVVKHDVHDFDLDQEGKDSWRLKRAGAHTVVISSPKRLALIQETDKDHTLDEIRSRLNLPVDIILSEGYKRGPHPKIEVFRQGHRQDILCGPHDNLIALASDVCLECGVPCIDLNDAKAVADLIEEHLLSGGRQR